jgi:hypothetical protein
MKFNDQQLTENLKQVQIPPDLKDQLRSIPEQAADLQVAISNSRDIPKTRFGRKRALAWLSLATTAILFFGLLSTNYWRDSMDTQIGTSTVQSAATDNAQNRSPASDMESTNRQINEESLTMVELQSEIYNIDREIRAIKPSGPNSQEYLDVDEYTSLVIATASQTAILSGVSIEYFRGDLEESIQRFPETRGSTIAAQLLASAVGQH